MILLLNQEAVIVEMLTALRYRVAHQLEVPLGDVNVQVSLQDQKLFPEVSLRAIPETGRAATLSAEQVTAELQNLGGLVRNEIKLRIAGLDE